MSTTLRYRTRVRILQDIPFGRKEHVVYLGVVMRTASEKTNGNPKRIVGILFTSSGLLVLVLYFLGLIGP